MVNLALFGGKKAFQHSLPPWPVYDDKEIQGLTRVLQSRRWFSGFLGGDDTSEVRKFEEAFEQENQSKHAIAVANGEAALIIALKASGVKKGDEVIIPAWTFVATASAVMHIGAHPVFADVEPNTLCLDPEDVRSRITPKTTAIITVHYGGRMGGMDGLTALCKEKQLILIEDAAHAHGSVLKNKKAGTYGIAGCFSFQESKTMTAGEGGIITTDSDEIANLARSFRSNGREYGYPGYMHFRLGWNYRMTEFQGAILQAQLERLEHQVHTRTRHAQWLSAEIDKIPGFSAFFDQREQSSNSHYLFPIRIDTSYFGIEKESALSFARQHGITRDASTIPNSTPVEAALRSEGIPCSTVYIPLYRSPMFIDKDQIHPPALPVSEKAFDEIIDLPHHLLLADPSVLKEVVSVFWKIGDNAHEFTVR